LKRCRKLSGLSIAVKRGEIATLLVWDVMSNHFEQGGAYLNLGGGAFSYVGKENWELIRNHIVNPNGEYYKNLNRYQAYYNQELAS
jgi:hypothetical protein